MTIFEVLLSLFASGILSALLALFYRFGRNQEKIDNSFRSIDERFKSIDERFKSIDERFKSIDERFKSIDERFKSIDERFKSLEDKLNSISTHLSKEIQELNTKLAVSENELSNISINVSHLMWHHQSPLHQKEVQEQ